MAPKDEDDFNPTRLESLMVAKPLLEQMKLLERQRKNYKKDKD